MKKLLLVAGLSVLLSGCYEFVEKPFSDSELVSIEKSALAQKNRIR